MGDFTAAKAKSDLHLMLYCMIRQLIYRSLINLLAPPCEGAILEMHNIKKFVIVVMALAFMGVSDPTMASAAGFIIIADTAKS